METELHSAPRGSEGNNGHLGTLTKLQQITHYASSKTSVFLKFLDYLTLHTSVCYYQHSSLQVLQCDRLFHHILLHLEEQRIKMTHSLGIKTKKII